MSLKIFFFCYKNIIKNGSLLKRRKTDSSSVRFVWTGVKAPIEPECRSKEPEQGLLEERVWVHLHTNSGAVLLWYKSEPTSLRPQSAASVAHCRIKANPTSRSFVLRLLCTRDVALNDVTYAWRKQLFLSMDLGWLEILPVWDQTERERSWGVPSPAWSSADSAQSTRTVSVKMLWDVQNHA